MTLTRIVVWGSGLALLAAFVRWRCGLKGHEDVLCTDHDRLFVRCLNCQRESVGLTLRQKVDQREQCLRLASARCA